MKIYLNRIPVSGAWGGGNRFVRELRNQLLDADHDVVHALERDIDVIFCFDPRYNHEVGVSYTDLLRYKKLYGTPIIQRVGDLGTHGKPELFELLMRTIPNSDLLIFPSAWAKDQLESRLPLPKNVIVSNKPSRIFKKRSERKGKSIVTHHWSTNLMKGFDTYAWLDENLPEGWSFTYIGRLPDQFRLKNSFCRGVLNDFQLVEELPKHDVYLTASKMEAGANHVLEAVACGLPVIYDLLGGSISEYCSKDGVSFWRKEDIIDLLDEASKLEVSPIETLEDAVIPKYVELICETAR